MIRSTASSIVLVCALGIHGGCGGDTRDTDSSGVKRGDAGPEDVGIGGSGGAMAGQPAGQAGLGGGGGRGGNNSGAPLGGSMAPAPDPFACPNCTGVCLFGVCLPAMPSGAAGAGGANNPGNAGSLAPEPGETAASCENGEDCASGVCSGFFGCRAPRCGDNVCNGEENSGSCAGDCPVRCGDAVQTSAEDCDDGNVETERCDYGLVNCMVCGAGCRTVEGATSYCGDGTLAASDGETCDDGNVDAGDGCDGECDVEVVASCGNNAIDAGEQCDDGNVDNFDGCNGACRIEPGWSCPEPGPGPCHETCGDAITAGSEACDDGNAEDGDHCSNDCKTARSCGDGLVQASAGEECDAAGAGPDSCEYGDGGCMACATDCKQVPARYCGDGELTDDETCDDGNALTETCAYGIMSCNVCNASCRTAAGATSYCGDARRDETRDEQCDDGNSATETCSYGDRDCSVCNANCQAIDSARYCGDGRITNEEACDDGNNVTEPCAYDTRSCTVCNANCQTVAGATHYCGDGTIDAAGGETCDDANTTAGDGCSAACLVE